MIITSKSPYNNLSKDIRQNESLFPDFNQLLSKIKYLFHNFLTDFQTEQINKELSVTKSNNTNIITTTNNNTKLFKLTINPLKLLQYFTYIDLYSVIYKGRSIYFFKIDQKIYVLSKSLIILDIIDIKDFQKVIPEGRLTIKLFFFNSKNVIQIRHFSKSNLYNLAKNFLMLNNPKEDYHFNYHYIKLAVTTLLNSRHSNRILNLMVNKTKEIISDSMYYYHREVYDLVNFNIKENINNKNLSNKLSRKLFFSIFFMFSQLKSLYKVYNCIYPFRNKLYFSKKKVMTMSEKNPIRVLFYQHEERFERPKSNVADLLDALEDEDNNISNSSISVNTDNKSKSNLSNTNNTSNISNTSKTSSKVTQRRTLEYKKHTPILKTSKISAIIYDPQYIEIFNYLSVNTEKIERATKSRKDSIFNKVVFNITIPKSFGKKEHKTLELNNNGNFIICERDRSDRTAKYNVNNIISIEGAAKNTNVVINSKINGINNVLSFDFIGPFEKYIFKTVVYNHILSKTGRLQIGNKIKFNCNFMTWNLAGIDVPNDLGVMFNSNTLDKLDMFAIGVQECGYFKISEWKNQIKFIISRYNYHEVAETDMCQMFLMVFVKDDLIPFIENVETGVKAMGFGNFIGNKGGMVISFKLLGYSFIFVNCHLAPKPYKVLERNKHVKTLLKSVKIEDRFAEFDMVADYLIWLGDLNYRLDYTFQQTIEEISNNNIPYLLEKDQLIKQRKENHIFYDFKEPEIRFFPTYRRQRDLEEYSNKADQSPSWCDRILVKTDRDIDFTHYDSIKNMRHSDHLPVLNKLSIYLTTPIYGDIEKAINQNIEGRFIYSNLSLHYQFLEAFTELGIEPQLPFSVKLKIHYFINKTPSESNYFDVDDLEKVNNVYFNDVNLNLPPQFAFDLPHSRAMNIFFTVTLLLNRQTYEIENIESESFNIMSHTNTIDISWRTRKLGTLSFNALYKL